MKNKISCQQNSSQNSAKYMYMQSVLFQLLEKPQIPLSLNFATGFVRVLENLESHGNLKFQNPGLENLENMCWSLKVLEN